MNARNPRSIPYPLGHGVQTKSFLSSIDNLYKITCFLSSNNDGFICNKLGIFEQLTFATVCTSINTIIWILWKCVIKVFFLALFCHDSPLQECSFLYCKWFLYSINFMLYNMFDLSHGTFLQTMTRLIRETMHKENGTSDGLFQKAH